MKPVLISATSRPGGPLTRLRPSTLRHRAMLIALIGSFLVSGCDDPPLDIGGPVNANYLNVPRDGKLPQFPEMRDQIPSVEIDLPPARAFDADDDALIDAIAATDGKVLIGFKPTGAVRSIHTGIVPGIDKSTASAGRAVVEAMGGEITRSYVNSATVAARIPPALGPELRQHSLINFVEPEGVGHPIGVSINRTASVSKMVSSANRVVRRHEFPPQDTSWGVYKVHAPQAWSAENRGQGVLIIILGTGIDQDHFVNASGDAHYNYAYCLHTTPTFTSCYDGTTSDDGHDSHVLGIAGAYNNAYGYIGIAPSADLASIKVCALGNCRESDIIGGLDWAISDSHPRKIVNMSFRVPDATQELATKVAQAYNSGVLLAAAAGNTPISLTVQYPARYSQVIAVSGTLPDDSFPVDILCSRDIGVPARGGSVAGPEVELSAPFTARSMWSHLRYDLDCGTSMASPVVSAVAAMVWTKWPTWTNAQVRNRLKSTVVDLGPTGRDQQFGYGRVDAMEALQKLFVSLSGPTMIYNAGSYMWQAYPEGGNGSFVYKWEESFNQSSWIQVGTAQTYTRYVGTYDSNWYLRVTVTSAGRSASKTIYVINQSGGCNPFC